MRLITILSVLFSVLVPLLHAQKMDAYTIFTSKGKKTSYKKMLSSAKKNEMIFFGEFHNNPIDHWLQLELTKGLYAEFGNQFNLSFEMFEADQQVYLTKYLYGMFDEKQFTESTKLWSNYKTDYAPIVDFAKTNKVFCLAANIPRRFASLLYKQGLDSLKKLPESDLQMIAPLNDFVVDTTLSQYEALLGGEKHSGGMRMLQAQAIKDATMAHFILQNKKDDQVYLHLNGAYHTDYYQGIIWYIKRKKPEMKIMSISTVEQASTKTLDKEFLGKADFIICVPETMTKTH
ncbi:MAG: iron-regulated protein [Bacteroidia bacterium]|nr:MAG: iron-regulated protein [Bacteroidia bacterium]